MICNDFKLKIILLEEMNEKYEKNKKMKNEKN